MEHNDDRRVYLYIQTYDIAEPYMERMLQSIKNQTYANFMCFIYDNCSKKPAVHAIIERYAKEDCRFVVRKIFDNKGKVVGWDYGIPEIIRVAGGKGYFTLVDADDELELNALETMVRTLEEDDAQMVCAGAYFLNGETGQIMGRRNSEEKYVIQGHDFGNKFPDYYQLMRTHWAKMMRMSVMDKLRIMQLPRLPYGKDTLFIREVLLQSDKVTVIPDIVYRYYLYHCEKTYDVESARMDSPRQLYINDLHFLLQKTGMVTQKNIDFLLTVYMAETEDTIRLVIQRESGIKEKIDLLYPLLTDEENRIICKLMYGKVYELLGNWLINQKFFVDMETMKKVAAILGIIGFVPGELTCYNEVALFRLLAEADLYVQKGSLKDAIHAKVQQIAMTNEICRQLPVDFLLQYSDLVFEILKGAYDPALELLEEYTREPFGYMELGKSYLIELGLTLSSLLNKPEKFVSFKKHQIRLWLESDREAAAQELAEWRLLLPEDDDFLEMSLQITEEAK